MNTGLETSSFVMGRWVVSCCLGWLLGVVLIILLSSLLDIAGIENMQFYLGVGMGAGVGFMQWRHLKKYIQLSSLWIWIALAGMGLPFIIIDLFCKNVTAHPIVVSIVAGSVLTGVMQYLLLKQEKLNAPWWIPASCIGWMLAVAATFSVDYTMQLRQYIGSNLLLLLINLVLILSGGPLLGWITGIALNKITRPD